MHIAPIKTLKRCGATLLEACLFVALCIIVLGLGIWIYLKICEVVSRIGSTVTTNTVVTIVLNKDAIPTNGVNFTLQRLSLSGSNCDWQDMASWNYSGAAVNLSVTTNYLSGALFRVRAAVPGGTN